VLRSAQKGEHAAPDLPKREALLSDGIQGTESDEGPVEIPGKRRRTKVNSNCQHSTLTIRLLGGWAAEARNVANESRTH